MKVLILNTFETKGGAAVAGKRLAVALRKQDVQVSLLVRDKKTADPFVSTVIKSRLKRYIARFLFVLERLQIFLANRFHKENLFAVSTASTGMGIINNPLVRDADIIHLHWINQGFVSLKELDSIIKLGKPIVWTMHDMWPVTSICHHARNCSRYTERCGDCKFLISASQKDLSYKVFTKKIKTLSNKGIQFVACSEWLRKLAELSTVKTGNLFENIPNPIDSDIFCPGDKIEARTGLGLPTDRKLILFGALIASDKRKGVDYLIEATNLLSDLKEEVELVFCGEVKEEIKSKFGLNTHELGYITNQEKMVKIYQAADCFVIPSLEENLPNMIMESMSCGIPCVAFETGGIPEMITHKKNGYIAKYKSSEDLAFGIRSMLDKSDDSEMKKETRDFVIANYSEDVVAGRYMEIYNKMIKK